MKKTLIIIAAILVMAMTLGACGKFVCDACHQEKSGRKHKMSMLGTKITICDDCYKDAQESLW